MYCLVADAEPQQLLCLDTAVHVLWVEPIEGGGVLPIKGGGVMPIKGGGVLPIKGGGVMPIKGRHGACCMLWSLSRWRA